MDDSPSAFEVGAIGVILALFFLLFLYLLICLWPTKSALPAVTPSAATTVAAPLTKGQTPVPIPTQTTVPTVPGQNAGDWNPNARIFGQAFVMSTDVRFMLVVALAAALGSFIQIATSFTTFVGNRTFLRSWIWWYALRTPIGVALALIFYFAVRGGFFTTVSGVDINPFGIAALGGLVGMFSKQASDKLQDVFEELFKSSQDETRSDKLSGPAITSSNPQTLTVSSTQLTLSGIGFVQGATATVDGAPRNTAFVDAQTLIVTLAPQDLQSGKTLNVVVTNPGPTPAASAPYEVRVA